MFDNLERAATTPSGASDAKSVADGSAHGAQAVRRHARADRGQARSRRRAAASTRRVHEAIQHVESAEHPAGVVLAEVQPGYAIGDRLVRAAMVVVSKGPEAATRLRTEPLARPRKITTDTETRRAHPVSGPGLRGSIRRPHDVGYPTVPLDCRTPNQRSPGAISERSLMYARAPMGKVIGIDLGTTNSCVAVVEGDGRHVDAAT